MKMVYKYPLEIGGFLEVEMPRGAIILSVQAQWEVICLWVLVDLEDAPEKRYFRVAGTGHPINHPVKQFIGTVQLLRGTLVFHVFEVEPLTGRKP
ncbi:MAG: hypothetical protein V1790_17435 [Planctomycetota bacterium]